MNNTPFVVQQNKFPIFASKIAAFTRVVQQNTIQHDGKYFYETE
jgi:hypothetical protein